MTVFPVGHYMGERPAHGQHVVRVGLEHRLLSADEFGVWVLAHGTAENGRRAWAVSDVLALAADSSLPGGPAAVDRLVALGALVVADEPRRFAESYRLRPLLVGLGNSPSEPDRYRVGFPGLPPVAELDAMAYELWQWGHLAPSLWHTCEVREKVAAGLGAPVSVVDLLDGLLGDVRELLLNSCAYLDRVR
ncbi:hypothetical protein [Actinophytocola sp.]|uniref:hypothetical protein n=1 Tax=Actinophytocola sp. TaxID=1872138 RepID=UPI002ED86A44